MEPTDLNHPDIRETSRDSIKGDIDAERSNETVEWIWRLPSARGAPTSRQHPKRVLAAALLAIVLFRRHRGPARRRIPRFVQPRPELNRNKPMTCLTSDFLSNRGVRQTLVFESVSYRRDFANAETEAEITAFLADVVYPPSCRRRSLPI